MPRDNLVADGSERAAVRIGSRDDQQWQSDRSISAQTDVVRGRIEDRCVVIPVFYQHVHLRSARQAP